MPSKNAPSRKKSLGYYNKANKTGTGAKAGGGMSKKGVAKYRRDNPGSKLKTAVTTPPSKLKKGSKAAKRRKSFCARSKGWTSERGRAARQKSEKHTSELQQHHDILCRFLLEKKKRYIYINLYQQHKQTMYIHSELYLRIKQ